MICNETDIAECERAIDWLLGQIAETHESVYSARDSLTAEVDAAKASLDGNPTDRATFFAAYVTAADAAVTDEWQRHYDEATSILGGVQLAAGFRIEGKDEAVKLGREYLSLAMAATSVLRYRATLAAVARAEGEETEGRGQ